MASGAAGTTGTRGLIIGKFMPVHAGHRYLIEAAREQVDHLTVVVCTRPDEPIPGALRYRWMRALYPDVDVLHSATTLPSYPHERPDFWNLWTRTLKLLHPAPIDYVFGSDDYIPQLAAHLGARPVVLDPARAMVPISATAIRADPFAYWDYIPDVVRPYFVRTVCVVGAESTGKTTLAERLARSIGTVWAPEYARGYLEGRADPLGTLTLDDMEAIARGHLAQAERLRAQANKLLILDTDLTTAAIYSRHYLGACPAWIADATERERHDLYLLCAPDTPWVADAQRDLPRLRAEMHARFEESLRWRRLPYVELRGAWDERFARAADAVAALLSPSAVREKSEALTHPSYPSGRTPPLSLPRERGNTALPFSSGGRSRLDCRPRPVGLSARRPRDQSEAQRRAERPVRSAAPGRGMRGIKPTIHEPCCRRAIQRPLDPLDYRAAGLLPPIMSSSRTERVTASAMKAIVVANGDLPDLTPYRALLAEADLIVAADGGARALLAGGVDPSVLVGDLDSLPAELQRRWRAGGGETLRFPVDKDATDLELAIETARKRGAQRIAVLGAFGGRPDHATANLLLLAAPELAGLDVALLGEGARVVAVRDDMALVGQSGDLLSLLPLMARAEGIVTEGLRYPLSGETLTLGSTRGVSNVFTEPRARVRLRSGVLLAMHTWDGQRAARW